METQPPSSVKVSREPRLGFRPATTLEGNTIAPPPSKPSLVHGHTASPPPAGQSPRAATSPGSASTDITSAAVKVSEASCDGNPLLHHHQNLRWHVSASTDITSIAIAVSEAFASVACASAPVACASAGLLAVAPSPPTAASVAHSTGRRIHGCSHHPLSSSGQIQPSRSRTSPAVTPPGTAFRHQQQTPSPATSTTATPVKRRRPTALPHHRLPPH
ncbi:hypothetical protein [Oryza sativa Japonica Group]|uniref:Uncharacterized protein n=1 Tax=Oryza sativa subsp. japonica TaxID=39947 RepID=Q5QLK0_ORYSJ|nr:hypothetical protein [Oryza sativa Japonica Group]BAD73701.1 hypothetical protein [Oryza sativa Japonica Group]